MNNLILIAIIIVGVYLLSKPSKFGNIEQINNENYNSQTSPKSCDYQENYRPYPSGKVPGSYLGLSEQEKDMLLMKFLNYNGTINDQYQNVNF